MVKLRKYKEKIKKQFLNNETTFDPLLFIICLMTQAYTNMNAEKFSEQEFKYLKNKVQKNKV